MKKIAILITCLMLPVSIPNLHAQETSFVQAEDHNVFTGLFRSVWARLKSLNPSSQESANVEVIYTAGIRGSESVDTLLTPYWKDDLTRDEAFQAELEQYSLAQLKMDKGELEAAVQSFDAFLSEYADSDLRPNALFGKSISQAGLGQTDQSLATMRLFVEENPNHPLGGDAQRVIDELS